MITISTQSYKKPSFIQPAYSVNGATIQSDKTGELSHRFIFDIYVDNTKVGRLKSLPSYYNYSSVEISDIIKNYVESEFLHQTPRSIPNDEDFSTKDLYGVLRTQYGFLPKIKVLAGEEYKVGGVLTMFDGNNNTGDPAVEVSSYYTTYQAMDANSPQTLVGRGGITNNQFQANHLDVLEYVHQANHNTYEWSGIPLYFKTDNIYQSKVWKNYHIKELSNRPLEREINPELPSSVSYYEGQHITLWNNISEQNQFDVKLSTFGRDYDMDPMNQDPLWTADWNIYRNRIHTIGFDFKDPAGLSVGEVRYQPQSPIFDQAIKDGFNFDLESAYQEDGVRVSEFLQTNVGAAAEYTKFEYTSSTDFINLVESMDYGDLRTGAGHYRITEPSDIIQRSMVNYKEEDKICQYTPPAYVQYDYNRTGWEFKSSGSTNDGGETQLFCDNGGYDPSPYVHNMSLGSYEDVRLTWQFYNINDRIEIIENGITLYDSGYMAGQGSFTFTPTQLSFQIKIYRDQINTLWDYCVYQFTPNPINVVPVTPNKFYQLDYNVVNTNVKIYENGNLIYESGVMTGTGSSGRLYITSTEITIEMVQGAAIWNFEYTLYQKDVNWTSLTLREEAFKDVQPMKPRYTLGGNSYLQQISTFTSFVNIEYFNNLGYAKNLILPNDLTSISAGEHFYIQGEYIIGVENSLGEKYGDRYAFNAAPCLKVWNNDENRWCNQDELERLTGRSLESVNFIGSNGRPAIEVLEATTYGQNEYGYDKQLSITFRVNRGSACPDVVLLPGIFNGLDFTGMYQNITAKVDRLRVVYGTDKSLRNANNYKLNVYDYDNHYNLIESDYGNGGKFIFNYSNWTTPLLSSPLVWTPGNAIPYWTYGVNGNYFGGEGQAGEGYLNSQTEQRMMSGLINNISTTPGNYTIFKSNSNAFRVDQDTLAMSYLLTYGSSELISQNKPITQLYGEKFGDKIYVQASCMILVEDTPEAVDITNLYIDDFAIGTGHTYNREIYRAQDKGRWKRIHTTIGVPISQFVDNPGVGFYSFLNLNVLTNLSTDANVWNGKYIDIADFKINYLFEETAGLSLIDNAAHKVYTKNLTKLNWNREPHFTFSGDMLRNEAFSLYWLNPYGAWDDYRFKGRSLKTTQVSRESRGLGLDKTGTLNSDAVRVRQNFGDSIDYKVNAYETYELTSDYLTDTEREWMEELFTSPKHYIYDEDKKWFIRVNLLNKEYSTIKKNNQKLYQIKIEVQVSSERRTQQVLGSL